MRSNFKSILKNSKQYYEHILKKSHGMSCGFIYIVSGPYRKIGFKKKILSYNFIELIIYHVGTKSGPEKTII